eukprot:41109-Ditylum_brightwellii.AAC.1
MSAEIAGTVKHVQAGIKIGDKFLAMTRWAQNSAGTGTPILEGTRNLKYLEEKWAWHLLKDMQGIGCTIQVVKIMVSKSTTDMTDF